MKWTFWIDLYIRTHCVARGLRPLTLAAYEDTLKQFHEWALVAQQDRQPDQKIDTIVERYRINAKQVFQDQRPLRYHHCVSANHGLVFDQATRTDGGGYEHQSDFRHGRISAADFRSRQ